METVGVGAGYSDALDAFEAAAIDLSRHSTVPEVAAAALEQALALTHSSTAFLALAEDDGEARRIFSLAADPAGTMSVEEIEVRSTTIQKLEVAGRTIGVIGIAGPAGDTAVQAQLFALFASQVAMALAHAQQSERRQNVVDTLVSVRADLDRSEKLRMISEERARSAERVERAHEASVDALLEVSRHARGGPDLAEFYRRLTRSIAELVAAKKVVFWQLDAEQMLNPIPGAYGVDEAFLSGLSPTPCAPERDDLASRIVFHEVMFRGSRAEPATDFDYVLERLQVQDAIAVPWRAGDDRLGLVAAYASLRSDGFSREDAWVLQKAGLAAGLVWQLRYTDTDLKKTVQRLEKVDAARQLLLKNVTRAADKARRRFAGELHDDALQKLTAAELQLQRLRDPNGDAAVVLDETQELLAQTEDALRRLLFEVRPPTLEVSGGLEESIEERINMLKSLTGAEVVAEIILPQDLSCEIRSMLYRQVTEAMANIEKHAEATRVRVALRVRDGGVHGVVEDNGRGFVVAERERLPGHLGLLALNERALLAGGWNNTQSEPGVGTTIEFWLPFLEEKV